MQIGSSDCNTEETQELKSKVNSLEQKFSESEQQLNYLESQEPAHRQLQIKYQEVCLENEEMVAKINKLSAQLRNHEQFSKEWDTTLESINAKIMSLETERDGKIMEMTDDDINNVVLDLQREKDRLEEELKTTKARCEESEKLSSVLQGKCDFSERLTAQLERENRVVEELRVENKELQATIAKLTNELKEGLSNQEHDFMNQVCYIQHLRVF
mgnify:FL=1